MPEVAAAASAAFWTAAAAIGEAGIAIGATVGVSAETSLAITAAVVSTATTVALTVGINVALTALTRAPSQSAQIPLKQSIPPRLGVYGRQKIGGKYALFEATHGVANCVLMLNHGRIDAFEQYLLHDDIVTLGVDGWVNTPDGEKYRDNHVRIRTRLGEPTETAYDFEWAPVWTADHRLDGTASLAMESIQASVKKQSKRHPNGLELPSAVIRGLRCYDPREHGYTDMGLEADWLWSDNPIIQLLDYLVHADHGMGLDFERNIRPHILDWVAAANVCDELVDLDAGGTERRYRSGYTFEHITPPAEVIVALLSACDGYLIADGTGALRVYAGGYYEPTVTLTDDDVIGYSYRHFTPDEEAVNELVPAFMDPDQQFNMVDAGVWRDEADITSRGKVRSQPLGLPSVPSATQALRIAKRQMTRFSAQLRGTLRTNLYGLACRGERYIRLNINENPVLRDLVVEIGKITFDFEGVPGLVIEWVAADTAVDDWNPASDEVPLTPPTPKPVEDPLAAPEITSGEAFYETTGSGVSPRIRVVTEADIESGLEWSLRWRQDGASDWLEANFTDPETSPATLVSGFVPEATTVELQSAYTTAGGQSPWSESYLVTVEALTIYALLDEGGFPLRDEAGDILMDEGAP